jgi:hypothetical protein
MKKALKDRPNELSQDWVLFAGKILEQLSFIDAVLQIIFGSTDDLARYPSTGHVKEMG